MRSNWFVTVGLGMVVVIALGVSEAAAADWTANFNFQYGRKAWDSKDWEPVQHLPVYGIESTWGKSDEPLLFATDLYYSTDNNMKNRVQAEVKAWELALGLRKVWIVKWLRPYAGAGVSLLRNELTINKSGTPEASGTDGGTGIWFGGGAYARLMKHLDLGIYARYTPANHIRVVGASIDGSSAMIGFSVGWGWGEKQK